MDTTTRTSWCAILGDSRMTANRALRELSALGVLKRIAGSGTFVGSCQSMT